jgi:hypothetical protein
MIARVFRHLMAILREIGDENAYRRHLTLHGREHSRAEWQHFHEHRLAAKYQRAKCC